MLSNESDRTNFQSMHAAKRADKTKTGRNLFAKIEAFEEMEDTSIRSGAGFVSNDDEMIAPSRLAKENFGFMRSTFARKYQTEVRGVEKDFSDDYSSDF